MIAAFISKRGLCAIRAVGRSGLAVKAQGYCGSDGNAAEGVYQVPDWALGRKDYQGQAVCPACAAALKGLKEPT